MAIVTWNPNDKSTIIDLSNNNLTVKRNTGDSSVRATLGKSTGKWYWEIKYETELFMAGVTSGQIALPIYIDRVVNSTGYYSSTKTINYSKTTVYNTDAFAIGNVLGIALDLDNRKISFYKNGVIMTNALNLDLAILQVTDSILYPSVTVLNSGGQITANFGSTAFVYNIPNGYLPYCGYKQSHLIQDKNSNLYTFGSQLDKLNTATVSDILFIDKGIIDPTIINGLIPTTRGIYGSDKGNLGTGKYFEFSLDSMFKNVNNIS